MEDYRDSSMSPREIKIRHIGNCMKADPAQGEGVAGALGIPMSEVRKGE
jgi:catalase